MPRACSPIPSSSSTATTNTWNEINEWVAFWMNWTRLRLNPTKNDNVVTMEMATTIRTTSQIHICSMQTMLGMPPNVARGLMKSWRKAMSNQRRPSSRTGALTATCYGSPGSGHSLLSTPNHGAIKCRCGNGHTNTTKSFWYAMDTINRHPRFTIVYPEDHDQQRSANG